MSSYFSKQYFSLVPITRRMQTLIGIKYSKWTCPWIVNNGTLWMPRCFVISNQGRIYTSRYNKCSDQVFIIRTTNGRICTPLAFKGFSDKFIPPCLESSGLISFQISPAYPRLNFATKICNPVCNIWRFYSPQEKRNLTSGRGKFVY